MDKLTTVLLVDDDETTNFLNSVFIKQVDPAIKVHTAENGKDALDFLTLRQKEAAFSCLLLLDTHMPVMDAWGFLEAFDKNFDKAFRENITILVLISIDGEQATKMALEAPNVSGTVKKPLSNIEFRALLKKGEEG